MKKVLNGWTYGSLRDTILVGPMITELLICGDDQHKDCLLQEECGDGDELSRCRRVRVTVIVENVKPKK